jgi:hypothetical protein
MVMQSVPTRRATNRLIRGNRTGVQKRCGSYSFCQDRGQGFFHGFPRRETSFRSGNGFEDACKSRLEIGSDADLRFYLWDRQELICTVGIAWIPRSKGEESFSDEFITSVAQLMLLKHGHGSFDDVESPAGESVLIGNECEEKVEYEFFGLEVSDPVIGSQSMVEPSEVARYFSHAVRHDRHEWFFKRHDRFSKLMMSDVVGITSCMENRLAVFDWLRKLQKLESLQLPKPSDLCLLFSLTQFKQSARFTKIAKTEADSKKKIQQINNFVSKKIQKSLAL